MDKKYLGKIDGERIYITKHTWDCEWYWGFGYVGNKNMHFHISSLMKGETDVNKIFEVTHITQGEWWKLREYFLHAYMLKDAAASYRYGAHNTTVEVKVTDEDMATRLNKDCETLLNAAWEMIPNKLR